MFQFETLYLLKSPAKLYNIDFFFGGGGGGGVALKKKRERKKENRRKEKRNTRAIAHSSLSFLSIA